MGKLLPWIRKLLICRTIQYSYWYMVPVASTLIDDILLVVFSWGEGDSKSYALNFKKVDKSIRQQDAIQMASEISKPMKIDCSVVDSIISEANQVLLKDEDWQEYLIAGLLEVLDIESHFGAQNFPHPLRNLIGSARAHMEVDDITGAVVEPRNNQARVRRI